MFKWISLFSNSNQEIKWLGLLHEILGKPNLTPQKIENHQFLILGTQMTLEIGSLLQPMYLSYFSQLMKMYTITALKLLFLQWSPVLHPEDLVLDKQHYGFVPPTQQLSSIVDIPLTLRAGDINLDNYPDFVCILQLNG